MSFLMSAVSLTVATSCCTGVCGGAALSLGESTVTTLIQKVRCVWCVCVCAGAGAGGWMSVWGRIPIQKIFFIQVVNPNTVSGKTHAMADLEQFLLKS